MTHKPRHVQGCTRTTLATVLNCLIATLCLAQAMPPITAADIYARAHLSVVVVIVADSNENPIGQGSGFIVAKNRIVTNHHVVQGAADALVVFADGTSELVAGVAADSPARDLAILVVKTGSRLPLTLGDEDSVRQGDTVYALGAPRGLESSFTNGIVSGFRELDDQFRLQTTAPIAPGSSGGPLFNSSGRVIGVTTELLTDSPGIYFSIGARDIKRLLRTPNLISIPLSAKVPSSNFESPDTEKSPTPTPHKTAPVSGAEAAEYAGRIEEVISEKGLTGRAEVQRIGNTIVLVGKLRPAEHGALLKFLRDAPASVRVVDHIEYEDTPVAESGHDADGGHPVPTGGRGAIHVVTDIIGATAVLRGPAGRVVSQCQTPCSFNDLVPERYGLEVQKDGYQPLQTALQVKAGSVIDQKATLEWLAKGLYVTSKPTGADVFVNGAKQSGQTPVTLPLAPGPYNLVLRMAGYDAYAGSVQVKDNIQTQLDVQLKEKSTVRVAWAQVETTPTGAEILVDGTSTGQTTPSRVQVPAGLHTVTVRLTGYQQVRRTIQATEGGTVNITNVTLQPK
jgi:S1-C subfamily serine protease